MTLDNYLTQNKVTNAQFAREGGWQRSVVGKWRNGDRRPQRTEDLDMILRLTHGKVTANDFYMLSPSVETMADIAENKRRADG